MLRDDGMDGDPEEVGFVAESTGPPVFSAIIAKPVCQLGCRYTLRRKQVMSM
jgi:hypothetical protein